VAKAREIAAGHDSDLTKVEPHIDEGADSVAVTQSTRDQTNAAERRPGDEREAQRGDDGLGC
jgi:hypothetical protein